MEDGPSRIVHIRCPTEGDWEEFSGEGKGVDAGRVIHPSLCLSCSAASSTFKNEQSLCPTPILNSDDDDDDRYPL